MEYIKIDELKHLVAYIVEDVRGNCLGNVAIWNEEKQRFLALRFKFGHYLADEFLHYDADDKYGTIKPIKQCT